MLGRCNNISCCVRLCWSGPALRDPEEGGGPSHGLAVSAGEFEGHAELPQPA